jgi:hypothetical protein
VSIRVRIHRALFDACVSQERVQIQLCSVSVGGPLRRLPEVILYVVRNIRGYSCRAPKAAYRALRDKGERIAQSEIQRRGISPPLSRISRHARQLQSEMWHKRCLPATVTLARCYLADFSSRPQKLIFSLNVQRTHSVPPAWLPEARKKMKIFAARCEKHIGARSRLRPVVAARCEKS